MLIDVNDRLPESGKEVLGFNGHDFVVVFRDAYGFEAGEGVECGYDMSDVSLTAPIRFWMELPEVEYAK